MKPSIMAVSASLPRLEIDFSVRVTGADLVDQLAFLVLLSYRHNGALESTDRVYVRGDNRHFLDLVLKFKNYDDFDGARSHCSGHLNENGVVNATYRGALDRADPGKREGLKLKAEIEKAYAKFLVARRAA